MYRLLGPSAAKCATGETSSPIPATRSRSCSRTGRTRCGHGTSRSSRARQWTAFYLYVILDVFSRYAVGWTVQYRENASSRRR